MKSIRCNFGDVIFDINTFNEKDYTTQLNHIKEFYIPCKLPKRDVKVIKIGYLTNKYMFEKYLEECKKRKGKYYESFENEIHKEIELPNRDCKIYLINSEEYICIKDNDTNYLILTDGRTEGIKWPFRTVREILVREREDNGNLFMHGTGVSLNGKGILILGNKGSGKTTLATDFMSEDFKEKGFISNDRVFMRDGEMSYFPIPIVVASGTIKNNKYLDSYFNRTDLFEKRKGKKYEETSDTDKVPIPLTDITEIFENVKLEARRKIGTIIFPKINLNIGASFKIEEMNEREKFTSLDRTCFTPFDSESLRLEWLRKRARSIDEIIENKYDVIQSTMKKNIC